MDSKIIAGAVIGALVVGGGSFYAGTKYAAGSPGPRGQGQFFTTGTGARGARIGATNGGFVAGSILAKDASSVTIQLGGPNATSTNSGATGSKIVLYNASTQVGKFTAGTAADLAVGDMVTIQGSTNTDGSITAQMIQIRPAGMGAFGGPRGQ